MDKQKLAQWGEKLKTSSAQMSRMVSDKVKEILQTPTPESKIVDEATSEMLEEPNWGMNLRICAMINSEEFSGTEIVRTIKRKIGCRNPITQRLSLDLLETCCLNCEKVFSEVASEKVLDEMVKLIENVQVDVGVRNRCLQLITAWGQSQDLEYLPVFRQTYMSLQGRSLPQPAEDGNSLQYTLDQQLASPPESYPIPETEFGDENQTTTRNNNGSLSVEEKNAYLLTTRNSVEILCSILNADTEPKPIKEDLTVGLLEKCKQSQPGIQGIIQSSMDDEAMLFEALNINDELQQVISRYEELEGGLKSGGQVPENSENTEKLEAKSRDQLPETSSDTKGPQASLKPEGKLPESSDITEGDSSIQGEHSANENKKSESLKVESSNEPSDNKRNIE